MQTVKTNSVASRGSPRAAIIGGGIVGAAIGFELACSGIEVFLIEKDGIAAHASGRNAGNLNPLYATPPALVPQALGALRLHFELRERLAALGCANYAIVPVNRLLLGRTDEERPKLQEVAARFTETDGFGATWLDAAALRECEPRLAPAFSFALSTTGNYSVDGYALTQALAAGVTAMGGAVVHRKATGIVALGARVKGIRLGSDVLGCDVAILAAGALAGDCHAWLGLDSPVTPLKGELLRLKLTGKPLACDVTWGETALYRRGGGELWVGITTDSSDIDERPTATARADLLQRASAVIPDLRDASLIGHTAALRPMTKSGLPIAARAESWDNAYVANGGGPKGLLLSTVIARQIRECLVADLALSERAAVPVH